MRWSCEQRRLELQPTLRCRRDKKQILVEKEPGDSALKYPLPRPNNAHVAPDSLFLCRGLRCAQYRPNSASVKSCYSVLPCFDLLVWSEGSTLPEPAQAMMVRVAAYRCMSLGSRIKQQMSTRSLSFSCGRSPRIQRESPFSVQSALLCPFVCLPRAVSSRPSA